MWLGARTIRHPRRAASTIHVPLFPEAAYGIGPFLLVNVAVCAAAVAPSGAVTVYERSARLVAG